MFSQNRIYISFEQTSVIHKKQSPITVLIYFCIFIIVFNRTALFIPWTTTWGFRAGVATLFLAYELLLKWSYKNDLPVLKMLDIFIYICMEYTLYIYYIFTYLVLLYEPLWHNTTEYIYGYYLTLMTCAAKGRIDDKLTSKTFFEWNAIYPH